MTEDFLQEQALQTFLFKLVMSQRQFTPYFEHSTTIVNNHQGTRFVFI